MPLEGSGISWNTGTNLGSLPEIIQQYKRMRPTELGALQKWLGTTTLGQHGSDPTALNQIRRTIDSCHLCEHRVLIERG